MYPSGQLMVETIKTVSSVEKEDAEAYIPTEEFWSLKDVCRLALLVGLHY